MSFLGIDTKLDQKTKFISNFVRTFQLLYNCSFNWSSRRFLLRNNKISIALPEFFQLVPQTQAKSQFKGIPQEEPRSGCGK